MMTISQMAALGQKVAAFLGLFGDCFERRQGRALLAVYVKGQLSELNRTTAEAMALKLRTAPRSLQGFLESINWNKEKARDKRQQILAKDHAHPEAIGLVDESRVGKSGNDTVGLGRQWNGKIRKGHNCLVAVHVGYATPGFQCLLDTCPKQPSVL